MMRPPLGMLSRDKFGSYGCVGCSRIMLGGYAWKDHSAEGVWACPIAKLATDAARKAREEWKR